MMQSLESTQYQAALAVSGAWKGMFLSSWAQAQLSCMKSLGGSPYLTEDGSEDFVNFTRFKMNSFHPWPTINIRPHIMHFRRLVFSYTE